MVNKSMILFLLILIFESVFLMLMPESMIVMLALIGFVIFPIIPLFIERIKGEK